MHGLTSATTTKFADSIACYRPLWTHSDFGGGVLDIKDPIRSQASLIFVRIRKIFHTNMIRCYEISDTMQCDETLPKCSTCFLFDESCQKTNQSVHSRTHTM